MNSTQDKEKEILSFWEKNKIYEAVKKKNSKGKPFYFMDGPPYATGHIHMGTALNKVLKDVAVRSRRLQGYDVFDRPGYDTHGVPIEYQIEKEIGSKSKRDIQKYGVSAFISKCKKFATQHIDMMNEEFKNLGVWLDWNNPYLTLSDEYIEVIWDVLKKAYEKDLLYLDKYSVHVCPRCETAVAFNEIEYTKQNDKAIFVKFPIKKDKKHYLIIWTTTPWTLPANLAVMAHPDVDYVEVETSNGEYWILAEPLVEKRMAEFGIDYKIVKKMKGSKLEGISYENPLSKHMKFNPKNERKVVLAPRYVTTEDGTGLVHCAPGHGKEDYEVGKENGLEIFSPVGLDGILGKETGKYAGQKARVVDAEIIDDLKKEGYLVYEHVYSHDYPLCWRCKTPLLMIAIPQWFLRISKIQPKLVAESEKVNWVPSWAKARMKAWLEGISDWPISRERYWGTPLPIWSCDSCGENKVIGSIAELTKLSGKNKVEVHKPEIDEIVIPCKCGKKMHRVSGVFDVWFDSGVSSWAALNYLHDKKSFDKYWPADLNIEGPDQFRGWWNSQLILSYIAFGKKPFETIALHGFVVDINKRKMSKSLGNATSPSEVIGKYGRDYLRYYLCKFSRGEDFSYNEKEFGDIQKTIVILSNVKSYLNQIDKKKAKLAVEDKWILSRFNNLIKEVGLAYNGARPYAAIDLLEKFLIHDLSRAYIQFTRDRSEETYEVLSEIVKGLVIMFSPIIPFMSEGIWQDMLKAERVSENSVNLSEMPKHSQTKINLKLEEQFSQALKIVEMGLAERDKIKVGLKWPLAAAYVKAPFNLEDEVKTIIARQLNVKNVQIKSGDLKVELEEKVTPELEGEGFAREIIRRIQAERKKKGLVKHDRIKLKLGLSDRLLKLLKPQFENISSKTGTSKFSVDNKNSVGEVFAVKEEKISIEFE